MAVLPKPPPIPGDPPDKFLHIVAFLVLAGLAAAAQGGRKLVRIALGLAAFGALIEIVQLIPALRRHGDPVDWIADMLAVAAVLGVVRMLRPSEATPPR